MKKIINNILGVFFILLGIIGCFLPILQGFLFMFIGFLLLDFPGKKIFQSRIKHFILKYSIGRKIYLLYLKEIRKKRALPDNFLIKLISTKNLKSISQNAKKISGRTVFNNSFSNSAE